MGRGGRDERGGRDKVKPNEEATRGSNFIVEAKENSNTWCTNMFKNDEDNVIECINTIKLVKDKQNEETCNAVKKFYTKNKNLLNQEVVKACKRYWEEETKEEEEMKEVKEMKEIQEVKQQEEKKEIQEVKQQEEEEEKKEI